MHNTPNTILIAVASPIEWRALWPHTPPELWRAVPILPGIDALLTGVGKSNAAGSVARALDLTRHRGVLNLGIAGALPGSGLECTQPIAATISTLADEGVQTPTHYQTCADLGFPQFDATDSAQGHTLWTERCAQAGLALGVIATVSTCSGTDELASAVARRTGARAEAMEGAAAGLAAFRLGVPFLEVRVISNTTGDRDRQVWNLPEALVALERTARAVLALVHA
jgi:futalosine hydrolase